MSSVSKIAVVFALALFAQVSAPSAVVFWNVAVVDVAAGVVLAGRTVEVSGGRITNVRAPAGPRPTGLTVIDATGKYQTVADAATRSQQIAGVVRDGVWLNREALDGLLERAAREARPPG